MEGLTRLVDESMARHGVELTVDHRRLRWSPWFRCDTSLSLLPVPSKAGVYTLAEEIAAAGETAATGGKRMLAIFQISETEELGTGLSRWFAPGSPLKQRLESGRLFARYSVIEDAIERRSALAALQHWLASSSSAAPGMAEEWNVQPASSRTVEPAAPVSRNESGSEARHQEILAPSLFPAGF